MTADPVTVIAEALDEWQGFDAHPRRKTMAQVVADALLAAGLLPQGPGPTAAACPHGDVTCPCQDGDPCHYEPYPGSAAMPSPMCKAPHAAVLHAAEADYERVEMRPYHEDAVVPPSPVPPTTEQDGDLPSNRVSLAINMAHENGIREGERRGLAAARNAVARVMKPEFAPHYTNDNEPKLSNWNQAVTNSLKQIDALLPAPTVEPADERRSE